MIHSPEVNSTRGEPPRARALSALELGSAHALRRGDAETALALAELQLLDTPRSGVSHTLLALASASLGAWVSCARAARVAFSLGSREAELCGLLAGLYQRAGIRREVEWIYEESGARPQQTSSLARAERDLMSALERALTEPLTLPRRAQHRDRAKSGGGRQGGKRAGERASSNAKGGHLALPSWIESAVSLDIISGGEPAEPPEWLVTVSESLTEIGEAVSAPPDWLERAPDLDAVLSIMADAASQGAVHSAERAPLSARDTAPAPVQAQAPAPAPVQSAPPMSAPPTSAPSTSAVSLEAELATSLTADASLARSLGLQGDLTVALGLRRVTLAQPNQAERALEGPLLLCLTAERLILLAHDGAQLRQKPWAFTPPNLLEVRLITGGLSLLLQGGRQINVQVTPLLIETLKRQLDRWRVS